MLNIDEKKKTLPPFNISSFWGGKKQHFSSETLTSSQFLKCRKSCYMFCFCYHLSFLVLLESYPQKHTNKLQLYTGIEHRRERERETTICPISHSLQQIRQFYTMINEIILCSLLKLQIHRVHFIVSFPNQLALLIQIFHYQKCFVKVKVNYTKCLHISILKTKNKKIFYLYHIFKYCL